MGNAPNRTVRAILWIAAAFAVAVVLWRAAAGSRATPERTPPRLGTARTDAPRLPRRRAYADVVATVPNTVTPTAPPAATQPMLRGRCVLATGAPVAAARVVVVAHRDGGPEVLTATTTDDAGRFACAARVGDPCRTTLRATAPGVPERIVPLHAADLALGAELGDVVLAEGTRVTGRVVDAEGDPLRASRIEWTVQTSTGARAPTGSDAGARAEGEAAIGDDGSFDLGILPPGWLECRLGPKGAAHRTGWHRVPAAESAIEIIVREAAPVRREVVLRTADGSVPTSAHIEPLDLDQHATGDAWPLEPPRRGDVWTASLSPTFGGPARVRAPGYRNVFILVVSGSAPLGTVDLVPGEDAVRIVLEGAAAGESVRAGVIGRGRRALRFPALTTVRVGPDLAVSVTGLEPPAPGEALIAVSEDGARHWRTRPLEDGDIRPGAEPVRASVSPTPLVPIRVEPATAVGIRIAVQRDTAQAPLRRTSWGDETFTSSGWRPVTDSLVAAAVATGGEASVRIVPGFSYRVTAEAPGWVPASLAVGPDLPEAASMVLRAGARVIVTGPAHPFWGGAALLDPVTRTVLAPDATSADSCEFGGVPPRAWILTCRSLAQWAASLPLGDGGPLDRVRGFTRLDVAEGAEVRVALPAPGDPCWVAGQVELSDPAVRSIDLIPAGLDPGTATSQSVGVDRDGTFEAGAYPAGEYLLRRFADPSRPFVHELVTLRAGERLDLELHAR